MAKSKLEPSMLGLAGPFTKIARVMSEQWGVQIVPSGFACSTDGNTIRIPFTADHLAPERQRQLHGMLDHEVSHVAEERRHKEAGRVTPIELINMEKNVTIRMLLNVYEDIRIELRYSKKYPGMAENLNALNLDFVEKFQKDPTYHKTFWHKLGCAIIHAARGYDTDWAGSGTLRFLDILAEEIEDSRHMEWAQESYDLAVRTYNKVRAEAEEIKEKRAKKKAKPKDKHTGEKGEESDSDEGSESDSTDGGEEAEGEISDGSGSDEGDEEAGGASDSDEGDEGGASSGEDDDEEGDEGEDGEEGAAGKPGSEDGSAAESPEAEAAADEALSSEAELDDLAKPLADEAERAARTEARAHSRYVPNPAVVKLDRWLKPNGHTLGMDNYNKAKSDVAEQIGAIRGRQLAYIQTITRKRIVGGLDSGRLDDAALSHIRTGSRAVFTDVQKGRALDTAIEVLIDLSGSMAGGDDARACAYYAKRTAIGLAEAWEPLRIPYEMIGFTNNHARTVRGEWDSDMVNRAPFDFFVFKAWNERLVQCRERFTAIRGYGDNADGEAVFAAACRLASRREKRKMLVVISDGRPAHMGIREDMLNEHLRQTVRMVTKAGIEVLGVGAGTDAPSHYYNAMTGAKNLIIKDLSRLAVDLFQTLRETILVPT